MVETARLKVGQKIEIRLKGLGTAGYVWSYSIEGSQDGQGQESDRIVSVAEAASEPPSPREQEDVGMTPGPPNSHSLDQPFVIQANEPGKATIRFTQRRPWEKDSHP